MTSLRYLIAARYIRSRKSHSVINIISGVSVMAMATPVAAMIVLLSVFNGLEGMVRQLYSAVDPDISVAPREGTTFAVADVDAEAEVGAGEVQRLGRSELGARLHQVVPAVFRGVMTHLRPPKKP